MVTVSAYSPGPYPSSSPGETGEKPAFSYAAIARLFLAEGLTTSSFGPKTIK